MYKMWSDLTASSHTPSALAVVTSMSQPVSYCYCRMTFILLLQFTRTSAINTFNKSMPVLKTQSQFPIILGGLSLTSCILHDVILITSHILPLQSSSEPYHFYIVSFLPLELSNILIP